jgi:hypothetical protein
MNTPFTALFYSNDVAANPVVEYCLRRLAGQVGDRGELVTVTWSPVASFGEHHVPLAWPDRESSHATLYRQILAGLDQASNRLVFLCEHDVLYPDDYFDQMAIAAERHGIVANRYVIHLSPSGFFPADRTINFLSNIAGDRLLLKGMIAAKLAEARAGKLVFAEPQGTEIATAFCASPVCDIRHGSNLTGMRTSSEYCQSDPVYGEADDFRRVFRWPPAAAARDDPAMNSRTAILNALIARYQFRSYLEIGLLDPAQNFDAIRAATKESVDPHVPATHQMTSDRFFSQLPAEARYDLIFIDGLHEEAQVLRDIENGMRHLSPEGAIVLHDCSPPTKWHQRPADRFVPGTEWNGAVWRALVRFRQMHPRIAVRTVDTDWGCAVIRPRDPETRLLGAIAAADLGWPGLERHRREWLNLITPAEFAASLRDAP